MKEATIVKRLGKDKCAMSDGKNRSYAGPTFSPWSSDEAWSDPVMGASPVGGLKTLNPNVTPWAGRYVYGAELYVGLLSIDKTNGNSTNHESSIIVPGSGSNPAENADWMTCKAVDGRVVQPQPYPPQAPAAIRFPRMWGTGDTSVDIIEYGGMSYGTFDMVLYGPESRRYFEFTITLADHLERGPLAAGPCIVRKATGREAFRFVTWCRCIDAAGGMPSGRRL